MAGNSDSDYLCGIVGWMDRRVAGWLGTTKAWAVVNRDKGGGTSSRERGIQGRQQAGDEDCT